ncbi:MAG TPA: flagellar motor protein MotB [Syntrophomonadaceae bacterium]|nr:flagellar motor protein MotB [Syntrophomonadaceae bacterium]
MAKKKKKEPEGEGGMERWLLSYADFITLLMVFFVVMYAMSRIDTQKYSAMANSLSVVLTGKAMSVLDAQGPSAVQGKSGQQVKEGPGQTPANQGQLDEVKKAINEFIKNRDQEAAKAQKDGNTEVKKLSDNIIIYEQERGLVISFKDTLLFASGSDELTPRAREIISGVGGALRQLPNYIRVEGHTDDLPISSGKFASNWELSVMRAANVVHVLGEGAGIPPDRLSIVGYGQYRPLVPNDDNLSRAMNRRVDIVILKQKYDYFEPPKVDSSNASGAPSSSGQHTQ